MSVFSPGRGNRTGVKHNRGKNTPPNSPDSWGFLPQIQCLSPILPGIFASDIVLVPDFLGIVASDLVLVPDFPGADSRKCFALKDPKPNFCTCKKRTPYEAFFYTGIKNKFWDFGN